MTASLVFNAQPDLGLNLEELFGISPFWDYSWGLECPLESPSKASLFHKQINKTAQYPGIKNQPLPHQE